MQRPKKSYLSHTPSYALKLQTFSENRFLTLTLSGVRAVCHSLHHNTVLGLVFLKCTDRHLSGPKLRGGHRGTLSHVIARSDSQTWHKVNHLNLLALWQFPHGEV